MVCAQNGQSYIDAVTIEEARADDEARPARRYLADVKRIADTGGWLVMNRVAVSGSPVKLEEAKKVEAVLKKAGIYIGEIAPYNMGRVDGHPVVFDYGGT